MNRGKGVTIFGCSNTILNHAHPVMKAASSSNQYSDNDILNQDANAQAKTEAEMKPRSLRSRFYYCALKITSTLIKL